MQMTKILVMHVFLHHVGLHSVLTLGVRLKFQNGSKKTMFNWNHKIV